MLCKKEEKGRSEYLNLVVLNYLTTRLSICVTFNLELIYRNGCIHLMVRVEMDVKHDFSDQGSPVGVAP